MTRAPVRMRETAKGQLARLAQSSPRAGGRRQGPERHGQEERASRPRGKLVGLPGGAACVRNPSQCQAGVGQGAQQGDPRGERETRRAWAERFAHGAQRARRPVALQVRRGGDHGGARLGFRARPFVRVAFDGNFRPRGWKGDLSRTRAVFMEALKRVDIALPTYDDEAVLWGDPSPEATVDRLHAFGIAEIVVKNGPNSALVASAGKSDFIPVPEVVVPVDTMAAGDSFNAAYIAARMSGDEPTTAAAAAHRLAGQVIRHRGSIMPRTTAAMH